MTPQWTKMKNRFFDDGRMKLLRSRVNGNDFALIYLMMQSLAGDCNCGGGLSIAESIPHTAETLGREFGFKSSVVKKAIKALEETQLIFILDGTIYLTDWEENQSAEKLELIRKQNRERQQKRRARLRKSTSEIQEDVTLLSRDSHATEEDTEKEKERETEIDGEGDGEDKYEAVTHCFNTATAFPKIHFLSQKQKKAIDLALSKYSMELLMQCFRMADGSEFLKGKNKHGWVANFDWLINPDNIAKVLNGNYASLYGAPSADDGLLSSFETDEFIEAALSRGFNR